MMRDLAVIILSVGAAVAIIALAVAASMQMP